METRATPPLGVLAGGRLGMTIEQAQQVDDSDRLVALLSHSMKSQRTGRRALNGCAGFSLILRGLSHHRNATN